MMTMMVVMAVVMVTVLMSDNYFVGHNVWGSASADNLG